MFLSSNPRCSCLLRFYKHCLVIVKERNKSHLGEILQVQRSFSSFCRARSFLLLVQESDKVLVSVTGYISSILWDWIPEIWSLLDNRSSILSQWCWLLTLISKFMLVLYPSFSTSVNVIAGNPLTQDILNLYQEPDGTRRLLNYLLDNLAGTAKRSKWSFLEDLFLLCEINVIITFVSTWKYFHSLNRTTTSKVLDYVTRTRPYQTHRYCSTSRNSYSFYIKCWSLLSATKIFHA